ncbi:hypothetical protein H0E87_020371 [Populus deltoides]|uniref:Equilibrative nucleotide transporter 3-like n=1 Tax=Populus deltoides TaxID=3696 RepID=A0A8T2XLI9_POPDE|nr:hypothetical protein H0E87_020371 [Populus deltoides]
MHSKWFLELTSATRIPDSKSSGLPMTIAYGNYPPTPTRPGGKHEGIIVCWFLGLALLSHGAKYHPSRVLTLVYQTFALGTMAILAYNEAKINTRKRNVFGYILFAASTLMLMVVDLATSVGGGIGPFIGICAIVAAFGVADAHVQGGMVGDMAFMCPEFMQSFFAGLAASGALTSALRLITKAAFDKSKDGPRKGVNLIYEYYLISNVCSAISRNLHFLGIPVCSAAADVAKPPKRLNNKQLIFQNIDYALDLYLIYVLTLSIFPGFVFENTGKHKLGNKWYPLVLIAMYSVLDLISRYIPLVPSSKLESRNGLLIAVLSRFLLIPAFYFTAKYGDPGWMIFLVSFLGLTNGYLTVCVLTIAPRGYTGPEANALGNLLVLFLLGGIFSGVALDWLWLIGKKKAF